GATDFVAFVAHSQEDTVLAGDRDYDIRDRRQTYDLVPQYYPGAFPYGDSVTITSFLAIDPVTGSYVLHPNLVFKPQFGGASLPSDHTFLPIGFSGTTTALTASLSQHAGQTDFSLSDPDAKADLGVNPRSDSFFANARHRFSRGVEVYADAIILSST